MLFNKKVFYNAMLYSSGAVAIHLIDSASLQLSRRQAIKNAKLFLNKNWYVPCTNKRAIFVKKRAVYALWA